VTEPFLSLLEAVSQPGGSVRVQYELVRGGLEPLRSRGKKAASRHARLLIDRLLQGDDPEIARLLLGSGALGQALGGEVRAREVLLEEARARGAARILAMLEAPLSVRVELSLEVWAVLLGLITALFVLAQLLLADRLAPGQLAWAFDMDEGLASLACVALSFVEAVALSVAAVTALESACASTILGRLRRLAARAAGRL
jgi:hypothetical protein